MRTFEFKNVLLIRPYLFPLIGFFVLGPIIIGATLFLHGGLFILRMALYVVIVIFVLSLKGFARDVTISFDNDHIIFQYGTTTVTYLKSQLIGFYSYNPFEDATSTISFCFKFNNGKKVDINDLSPSQKIVREKEDLLRNFLTTAQEELHFAAVSANKVRRFWKIGSTWYSRKP